MKAHTEKQTRMGSDSSEIITGLQINLSDVKPMEYADLAEFAKHVAWKLPFSIIFSTNPDGPKSVINILEVV